MNDQPITPRQVQDLVSLHASTLMLESAASLMGLAVLPLNRPSLIKIATEMVTRAHAQQRDIIGILARAGVASRIQGDGSLEIVLPLVTDGAVGEGALRDEEEKRTVVKRTRGEKKKAR